MRVVQLVCSDGFGGVEQYILNLTAGLRDRGVDVDVVGGDRARMGDALTAVGAGWHPGDNPRQAFASLRSLAAPDLLVSHMSQADLAGWAYTRLPRGSRVRQVSTRHFAAPRGRSLLARALFRAAMTDIAAQLAISAFVAADIDGDSVVVHTGVARCDSTMPRKKVVLVAQRLEAEKDTETAVRAWAAASARLHGWALQIAGDGAQRARLEALVVELGVQASVEFLGFRRDVGELLQRVGVVLAPTPREGLGILVLEAMAAGAPVIAAGAGGHLETVGAARPDLLFPPRDFRAAAAVLDRLVADAETREVAGRDLQNAQRERFTAQTQVDGTLSLYRSVLA